MTQHTFVLNILKEVGPYGSLVLLTLFYFFHQKNNGNNGELRKVSTKLDTLIAQVNKILIDLEQKVPFAWIEKELAKYQTKELADFVSKEFKEDIKVLHKRIDIK